MKMPAMFIGHGSPMNAIEDNEYSREWKALGKKYQPKGILMISGHWFTRGLLTQDVDLPEKIDDMYGFPRELYDLKYPVHGDHQLTQELLTIFGNDIRINNEWGIDHGAWSVLVHMYPEANIPVVQLSVNMNGSPRDQYEIGKKIAYLREQGYMIIASGNVVHSFQGIMPTAKEPHPWARKFDEYIERAILDKDYEKVINYLDYGQAASLSAPTPEHFYPILTFLGTYQEEDKVQVFNKAYAMASFSMTSYIFDEEE